jgi:predicted nucleic acid-binding protein
MATERIVVDSSYLIEAVLPTTEAWRIDALYLINAIAIGDVQAVCPHLLQLEIASVCNKKIRPATAQRMFDLLESLEIDMDVNLSTARGFYTFARSIKCQVYDGVFIDLAKTHKLRLATRDSGQIAACRALKIGLWAAESQLK